MSRRILLADDSVTIQKVIELTFMDEDYEVTAVSNGDEAIALLDQLRPDFVIADVHMPGANGYQVCRRAKETAPERPVLLLVGTFEPFDEGQSRAAGADAFLKKPFDSQELLQLVGQLLGGAASGAGSGTAASGAAGATVETAPPIAPPPAAPVDFGLPDAEPIWGNFEPNEATPLAPTAPAAPWSASAPPWEIATSAAEPVFELDGGEPSEELVLEDEVLLVEDEPFQFAADAADVDATDELAPLSVDEEPFRFAPEPPPAPAAPFAPSVDGDQLFRFDAPESALPFGAAPAFGAPAEEAPFRLDEPPPLAAEPEAPADSPFLTEADEEPFRFDAEPAASRPVGFEPPAGFATARQDPAPAFEELAPTLPANGASGRLSDEDVDRIARRVLELAGDKVVRDVAWEVIPDMAELVIKDRLRELEAQVE